MLDAGIALRGEYLSDSLVRVPLFVRVPGRPPATRDDTAGLVDLRATLVGLLFGEDAAEAGHGRNLLIPDAENDASEIWLANLRAATVQRLLKLTRTGSESTPPAGTRAATSSSSRRSPSIPLADTSNS